MITGITITSLVLLSLLGYVFFTVRRMKMMPVVANHADINVLTSQNFGQQIKKGVYLVDFWAPWCMPCKMIAPILNDLAADSRNKTNIGKLDIDKHQSIAAQYKVQSIPTLILFKDGKEVERFIGVKTKDYLLKQISKHI